MKDVLTLRFIEKAKQVHGDKYSYDNCVHRGVKVKVLITCAEHGDFLQRMDSHLSGAGCKSCLYESMSGKFKHTTESYITELREIHGDSLSFEKTVYKGSRESVMVTCPIHGDYTTNPNTLLNGSGCRKCSHLKSSTTRESFLFKAREIHSSTYDYSLVAGFENSKSKVEIICRVHGSFTQTVAGHLSGSGCMKCGCERAVAPKRIRTEDFIRRSVEIHGDAYDYSLVELDGGGNRINIICPTHGIFDQVAITHLSGRGCRFCRNDATTYNMVAKYKDNTDLGSKLGTLYVAKFSDEVESFLKLGISSDMKMRLKRYRQFSKIYSCEIIKTVEMTNLQSAEKERDILKTLRQQGFRYKPLKKFSGWSECLDESSLESLLRMVEL